MYHTFSEKWSIGTTYGGRSIWAYRLSDNPDVDESEPEVLIDGAHHAREIMAAEFPVMFAQYLCEHYDGDPAVRWLVDNRELYLVPVVNPDGFVYNETTNPGGGGMWRKNRSPQAGGQVGVDLNRNYPLNWGYDDVGSSPNPADITYRGPSAASELETQAMIGFVNSREIITHDSVHTYSGLTLYPWGYADAPTPHDQALEYLAQRMTATNGYAYGRPGAVLYEVNGGTFDTFYGITDSHQAIFSMSNEIGSYGFWPPEENRAIEFHENLEAHLVLMRAAGPWLAAHTPVVNAAAKDIGPGEDGTLSFTIENVSVAASALDVQVSLATDDPWIQLGAASRIVGAVAAMGSATLAGDPIPLSVDAACPAGHQVLVNVSVRQPGGGDLDFPLAFTVGAPQPLFSDDFESGTANWTLAGAWGTTATQFHSATRSLTDTPSGSYANYGSTYAQLDGAWRPALLRFWHRYATEAGYDFCQVQVSAGGGPWTTVASYNGVMSTWTQVSLDLSAFAGQDLAIRFHLATDATVIADGWYIDDVELLGATAPFAMSPPVPVEPIDGAVTGASPTLRVANSLAPGGGAGVYGFRIYADAACTQLVDGVDDLPADADFTTWSPQPLTPGAYWWRAWAGDGAGRTPLTAPENFSVQGYTSGVAGDLSAALRVLGGPAGDGARVGGQELLGRLVIVR